MVEASQHGGILRAKTDVAETKPVSICIICSKSLSVASELVVIIDLSLIDDTFLRRPIPVLGRCRLGS